MPCERVLARQQPLAVAPARGLEPPQRDEGRHRILFPAGLVVDLDSLLGCRVQVVTEEGLYWRLRRRILGEAIPL
jgi:hypothetical protein